MKNYLKRKTNKKSEDSAEKTPARITNETVAEHREQILAGGRKYKYPVQYQKHKLVINSIIIGVIAVVLLTIFGWYQLYVAQNSSELMYRVTQILPVRVASVDGEPVPYSDYLMRYRSSLYYSEHQEGVNFSTDDGKRQAEYYKRRELNNAEEVAYAHKVTQGTDISVTDTEVDAFIQGELSSSAVSLNAYEKTVLNSYFGWSLSEYKKIVKDELLKRKAAFYVDTAAKERAERLRGQVIGGADIVEVAKTNSDDDSTKANGGDSGNVSVKENDVNGLIAAAQGLQTGQVSELIQGVDSYYFIKLVSKDGNTVRYNLVRVKLTAFDDQFASLSGDGKIKEYISVEQAAQ